MRSGATVRPYRSTQKTWMVTLWTSSTNSGSEFGQYLEQEHTGSGVRDASLLGIIGQSFVHGHALLLCYAYIPTRIKIDEPVKITGHKR